MTASKVAALVIWHTFDVLPAATLKKHVDAFAAARGIEVRLETGMDVVGSLMDYELMPEIPDAVIGPSDIIGHADEIGLHPVAKVSAKDFPSSYAERSTQMVTFRDSYWGYPLVWGNHLLLYRHSERSPETALNLQPESDKDRIALLTGEPYVFLMMLLGRLDTGAKTFSGSDISEALLTQPLKDYKTLISSGSVAADCDYQCVTRDFFQGRTAYAINGDWALGLTGQQKVLGQLRASATGNDKILFDELERAVCIVPDQRISSMWPALRKGLRLYTSGVRTAEEAARYILQLAN